MAYVTNKAKCPSLKMKVQRQVYRGGSQVQEDDYFGIKCKPTIPGYTSRIRGGWNGLKEDRLWTKEIRDKYYQDYCIRDYKKCVYFGEEARKNGKM